MATPPTQIETERLILRRYKLVDAFQYYELGMRNRDHLARYEEDNPMRHLASVDEAATLLAAFAESWDARECYFVGIFLKQTGALIGQIYVGVVTPGLHDYVVGYVIDRDHQGSGYVTEAVRRVTRWLFEDHGAHRIQIECDDSNTRSAAVARRCGFRQGAHHREHTLNPDGTVTGTLIFELDYELWDSGIRSGPDGPGVPRRIQGEA